MTDTTAPAPDAADLRGRPGAGALLAEQMNEAGERVMAHPIRMRGSATA